MPYCCTAAQFGARVHGHLLIFFTFSFLYFLLLPFSTTGAATLDTASICSPFCFFLLLFVVAVSFFCHKTHQFMPSRWIVSFLVCLCKAINNSTIFKEKIAYQDFVLLWSCKGQRRTDSKLPMEMCSVICCCPSTLESIGTESLANKNKLFCGCIVCFFVHLAIFSFAHLQTFLSRFRDLVNWPYRVVWWSLKFRTDAFLCSVIHLYCVLC